MLYVLTVHHGTSRWIKPQLRSLRRFVTEPYRVWAITDNVPLSSSAGFDAVFSLDATHSVRLNHLAHQVEAIGDPDDWLLFLDSDALLVRSLAELLQADTTLVAIRRDENIGDIQPHPSFALMPLPLWQAISGDWRPGDRWRNAAGWLVTDTGARMLRKLNERSIAWEPLLRMNTVELHPLWFGVYGTAKYGPVAYHHGAGSRGRVSRVDVHRALIETYGAPLWKHRAETRARLESDPVRMSAAEQLSERVLQRIEQDEPVWETLCG